MTGAPSKTGNIQEKRLLIVEDDPVTALTLYSAFKNTGIQLFTAPNAELAIEMLRENTNIFCVFTDLNMPGRMDGHDLGNWLAREKPHLPVIFGTGGGESTKSQLQGAGRSVFTKPYDMEKLTASVLSYLQ
jgi:CheY-like chemotaxis protein